MSFYQACDAVLKLYTDKVISNKIASEVFKILAWENDSLRIEKFRDTGYGKILKYSAQHKGYIFECAGKEGELASLNRKYGKYHD